MKLFKQTTISNFIKTYLFIFCLSIHPSVGKNITIKSFYEAKLILNQIHSLNKKTFYCNCSYEKRKTILNSCGYKIFQNYERATRIEWEHVLPASRFGKKFKSWKIGNKNCKSKSGKLFKGRKCARKISKLFRFIESDLYNLQPVIGEINQFRNNYTMSIIDGEERKFGKCDFEVKNKVVEPANNIRGNIARIYFYMSSEYPNYIKLTKKELILFQKWDLDDPVDKWECMRSKNIEKFQKSHNWILINRCKN